MPYGLILPFFEKKEYIAIRENDKGVLRGQPKIKSRPDLDY